MIKEIIKDETILKTKSIAMDIKKDDDIITDLIETAVAHQDNCAGLAAIQIGAAVKCFVVFNGKQYVPVINPRILKHSTENYLATEGCLSLEGTREVKRWKWIDVIYANEKGKYIKTRLSGYIAEVFQHEYDHLDGKLI